MYALIENDQFVRWIDLQADYPNTSFPLVPSSYDLPEGVVKVDLRGPSIPPGPLEVANLDPAPVFENGRWRASYTIVPLLGAALDEAKARLQQQIVSAAQRRLDTFAQTRGYDGILSACTYASSNVEKFCVEGQYCVEVRDSTWAALYQLLSEVEAGARPVPNGFEDIEPELPVLAWPN